MTGALSWIELLVLMTEGPDLPMRGRIRHMPGASDSAYAWLADADEPPLAFPHAAPGNPLDVAWWGDRIRLADADGTVILVSDGTTAWSVDGDDPPGSPLRESPRSRVRFVIGGTELLVRKPASQWIGDDFTRPTGPVTATTLLGRSAYEVELAPPPGKPHAAQLVVDAETGMPLQLRGDAVGMVSEWTELAVGDTDLDPQLFTWEGPVVTWAEQVAEHERGSEAERRMFQQWPLTHLGTRTLTVPIDAEVRVIFVRDDGYLLVYLAGVGELVRRPHTDTPWDDSHLGGRENEVHRWSDPRWDWSLECRGARLAPGALEGLRAQLERFAPAGTTPS